jgi:hypothetical protein
MYNLFYRIYEKVTRAVNCSNDLPVWWPGKPMEPLEREARHFKVLASTTMGSSKYQTKTAQFREREREREGGREREQFILHSISSAMEPNCR